MKRVSHFWNNNYLECKSNGDRSKNLSLKEYSDKSKPYLRDIIIDPQNSDTWRIHLAVVINFISSKGVEEEHAMQSKSDKKYLRLIIMQMKLLLNFSSYYF